MTAYQQFPSTVVVVKSKVWPKKYQIFNSLDVTIECYHRVCFHIYNGKSKTFQVLQELWLHEYVIIITGQHFFTILNLQERDRHKVDR